MRLAWRYPRRRTAQLQGVRKFEKSVAAARSTGLRLLHFSTPNSFGAVSLQVWGIITKL